MVRLSSALLALPPGVNRGLPDVALRREVRCHRVGKLVEGQPVTPRGDEGAPLGVIVDQPGASGAVRSAMRAVWRDGFGQGLNGPLAAFNRLFKSGNRPPRLAARAA